MLLKNKQKGITPVISVIMLLFIAIALVAMASQFFFGYIQSSITTSFEIPPNGAFCQYRDGVGYRISVYIKNTGTGTITENDVVAHTIDDVPVTIQNLPLRKGDPAALVIFYPLIESECAGGSCKGYHTVTIGTSAGIRNIDVFCP